MHTLGNFRQPIYQVGNYYEAGKHVINLEQYMQISFTG